MTSTHSHTLFARCSMCGMCTTHRCCFSVCLHKTKVQLQCMCMRVQTGRSLFSLGAQRRGKGSPPQQRYLPSPCVASKIVHKGKQEWEDLHEDQHSINSFDGQPSFFNHVRLHHKGDEKGSKSADLCVGRMKVEEVSGRGKRQLCSPSPPKTTNLRQKGEVVYLLHSVWLEAGHHQEEELRCDHCKPRLGDGSRSDKDNHSSEDQLANQLEQLPPPTTRMVGCVQHPKPTHVRIFAVPLRLVALWHCCLPENRKEEDGDSENVECNGDAVCSLDCNSRWTPNMQPQRCRTAHMDCEHHTTRLVWWRFHTCATTTHVPGMEPHLPISSTCRREARFLPLQLDSRQTALGGEG